ncbi:hypothetical protein PYCC9005_005191 [Savitreella phatthalungensis]
MQPRASLTTRNIVQLEDIDGVLIICIAVQLVCCALKNSVGVPFNGKVQVARNVDTRNQGRFSALKPSSASQGRIPWFPVILEAPALILNRSSGAAMSIGRAPLRAKASVDLQQPVEAYSMRLNTAYDTRECEDMFAFDRIDSNGGV